jgi:uncharacterized membrane protein YbhN (UPF0104 family)
MRKKRLALALKFAVSGALLGVVFAKIDAGAVTARLAEAEAPLLALAGALFLAQIAIGAGRWRVVLTAIGTPLPFALTLKFVYIGAFFNQALPSSVGGDAVRVYKAWRAGLGLGGAVAGVMLERVATVVALLLLVLAVQPFFLSRVDAATGRWTVGAASALLAAALAGLALLMALDRLPDRLLRFPAAQALASLAGRARRVFLDPATSIRALAWSCAGHANLTCAVYVLGLGLGLSFSLLDCFALFLPVLLAMTLPISIAGWGVREGAMVAAFGLVGVPSEGALALSLLFGLVAIVTALPGGALWFVGGDRPTGRDLERLASAASSERSGPA